jgi:hypothetical protein
MAVEREHCIRNEEEFERLHHSLLFLFGEIIITTNIIQVQPLVLYMFP